MRALNEGVQAIFSINNGKLKSQSLSGLYPLVTDFPKGDPEKGRAFVTVQK